MLGENHPRAVGIYYNLAILYDRQNEYEKAKEIYRQALPIAEKVLGTNHNLTCAIRNRLEKLCDSRENGL